jgi:hypothetical protein
MTQTIEQIEQIIEDQKLLSHPILTQFPLYCPKHITKTGRNVRSKRINLLDPTYINKPEGYVDYDCPSCSIKYRIFKRVIEGTFDEVEKHFDFIQFYLDLPENDRLILESILRETIEYRQSLVYFASFPKEVRDTIIDNLFNM